jgi:hypothetical protein
MSLPAGLTHLRDGTVTFNPDEEVQERIRLVFAKFRELRSAKAVMRYLRRNKLLIPVRPLRGAAPHDLVWRAANSARVMHILKNPAGAHSIPRQLCQSVLPAQSRAWQSRLCAHMG